MSVEKCSEEIKLDSIESKGTVHVKIDDVCTYTYGESFFESNCSFTFFDENGNLESYNKSLGFPVYQMSKAEYRKMIADSRVENRAKERKGQITVLIFIFLVGFFISLFLIKRFRK